MPITINLKAKRIEIEGQFIMKFKRKREDIKEVLQSIESGKKMDDIFPSCIAKNLSSQFIKKGYIDNNQKIQSQGLNFIKNPFNEEEETSIYTLDLYEFELGAYSKQIITNATRRLVNQERSESQYEFNDIVSDNEFQINNEKVYFSNIENNTNKMYCGNPEDKTLIFDISDETYNAENGPKYAGEIIELVKDYIDNYIDQKIDYFTLSQDKDSIIIKSLKDFSDEELIKGYVSSLEIDNIEIINMPICIDSKDVAIDYAYLYIYSRLIDGEYLSYEEMNELFVNEIMSKNIFSNEVKDEMLDFTYSEDGFRKHLDKKKYSELRYKLNVMKELLELSNNDTRLINVRNYKELVDYISDKISPNETKKVYFVLGYAMAKTSKNKIIECIEAFNEKYNSICIIAKNNGSNQKMDDSIRDSIVAHNVDIKTNTYIGERFHDRYLIFEMKDGTYKCMLSTAEVGQFFDLDTNETKGTIMLIPYEEVIKSGKSLISMVKEAN